MVRMTEREASKGKGKGTGKGKGKGAGNAFQFSSIGKGRGKGGRGRGGYTGGYRGAAYYDTAYDAPAYDSCANDSAAHAYNESAHHSEPDAYAYDESAQHAYYGEYNEGGGDTDWSIDYAYTASSAYAVTSDPNGGLDDSFAAFSVDTNFDLDDPLDDGSHDHMGYVAEVIELSEPSGLLAVARRALHGSAKILVSAAAFAVAIAFSKPNETFVALDCLLTTVLHPNLSRSTPKNERDVALCGGEAEGRVKNDIVSENSDVDAVVANALNVSACDGATWVNDSGATRHMVQDRRLCFNVRKAKNTSIQVADGKVLKAEYIGDAVVSVLISIDGYGDPLTCNMLLTQVLIAPGLGHNLYSSRYGWEVDEIKTVLNTPDGNDKYCMILPNHTSVELDRSTGGHCLIHLGTKRIFSQPHCPDRNAHAERLWYTLVRPMRIMIAHAGYDELKAMLWPFLMPPPTSARRSPRVVFAFVAGLFTVSATSSSMGNPTPPGSRRCAATLFNLFSLLYVL